MGRLYAGLARRSRHFVFGADPVRWNHGSMAGESPSATIPVFIGKRLVCRVGFPLCCARLEADSPSSWSVHHRQQVYLPDRKHLCWRPRFWRHSGAWDRGRRGNPPPPRSPDCHDSQGCSPWRDGYLSQPALPLFPPIGRMIVSAGLRVQILGRAVHLHHRVAVGMHRRPLSTPKPCRLGETGNTASEGRCLRGR